LIKDRGPSTKREHGGLDEKKIKWKRLGPKRRKSMKGSKKRERTRCLEKKNS
jgi:hypothetical protein